MCHVPAVWYGDSSTIIQLHFDLFINQKDIMHLIAKIRVFTLKIILDFERFDIHLFEMFLKP